MAQPAASQNVPDRLLESAKKLFASQGFEKTTTAVIARDAATSESQLIKYFGSKEGLLLRIFELGWTNMSLVYAAASIAQTPQDGLRIIFEQVVRTLSDDRELRDLMMFEGRRIRGKSSEVVITAGYYRLHEEVTKIVAHIISANGAMKALRPRALASALIGMLESMLRDQAISERTTGAADPTSDEIRAMFQVFSASVLLGDARREDFPGCNAPG